MKKTQANCQLGWGEELVICYIPEYDAIEFTTYSAAGIMLASVQVSKATAKKLAQDITTICDTNLTEP